jgi:hypothetical protein
MSAGITTSYYNVWGKSVGATVPYLSGGRKSYGDYLDTNFKSVYTISSDDLKALVKTNANIELSGDPSTWLSINTHGNFFAVTNWQAYPFVNLNLTIHLGVESNDVD